MPRKEKVREVSTSLAQLRVRRGVSAVQLAKQIGVSRQTVYAIEAGTYVPNTAVALRLARVLETTVEDLFSLPTERNEAPPHLHASVLLPGAEVPLAGQAVQLCRVDKRLVAAPPSHVPWYFPNADAIVSEAGRHGKTTVQAFHEDGDFSNRILVAGCDPAISVLARHAQTAGVELVLAHRNSAQALSLLEEGCVHVAGTHLKDEHTGESNLPQVERLFPKHTAAVISFATWEQGLITARGNPKNIRSVEDLTRKNISMVNREKGSGSRALLDARLKRAGIPTSRVDGYDQTASGHLAAAWQVSSGAADCCVGTGAAARMLGLHFIPLVTERYDLVVRKQHLALSGMQTLIDTLSRISLRRELEVLGGYDTGVTGQRLV